MALSRIQKVVILAAIGTGFVSAGFARELYSNYQVDSEIARLQARTKELEAEKVNLSMLKDKLASQDFLEAEARLKLGLKKPGETAIIIPEEGLGEELGRSSPNALQTDAEQGTPLQRWMKHFFD